jgi:hypothetical protein
MESLPKLVTLQDLSCSSNQLYMIGTSLELSELLPSLSQLDLHSNSLYSKLELLCLARMPGLVELDLRENPCSAYAEFEREVAAEFPCLRTLNGKQLARLTPKQQELAYLKATVQLGPEEESKEMPSARPSSSRGVPAKRPNAIARVNIPPTMEEMHRRNFLEDLNASVLALKQEFKAAMSRIKHTLQSLFAQSAGEQLLPTAPPQVLHLATLPSIEEMDEDKSALEQSFQLEEDQWFSAEITKSQDPVLALIQRTAELTDTMKSSHKAKRKLMKLDKQQKVDSPAESEEPILPLRTNSRQRQKLIAAQTWTAKETPNPHNRP